MTYAINSPVLSEFTEEQFFQFCQANPELRLERNAHGQILLVPPTTAGISRKNSDLNTEINNWNRRSRLGVVFDSNVGFTLPNSAVRSPDVSWVSNERWSQVSSEEEDRFPPVCPDFVIELLSKSDSLTQTKEKMEEWMANGCLLGWLINPRQRETHVYRANGIRTTQPFEEPLSGQDVLPDFTLDLREIFAE